MLVPVILCDRLLLAIAKNGVCTTGVTGARGSFMFMGVFLMVRSSRSCSISDLLCCIWVWTSTS